MESPRHLEGIAREIHEETGIEPPIDALDLAGLCGIETVPWRKRFGALLLPGDEARALELRQELAERPVIFYPLGAQPVRVNGVVAHEIGHWALARGGCDPADEEAADYLAGALMLPDRRYRADMNETDFDLDELRARHPNASMQMLAVRMCQLAPDTTCSVWDAGKLHASYGAALVEEHRAVVMRVLESGHAEHGIIAGYPVFSPGFRRVVVVERT
jgi:hypothetical protein